MDTNKNSSFSVNLKNLMKQSSMRNIDLARLLGVSKSAISNYLSGYSVPPHDTRTAIAGIFQLEADDLLLQPDHLGENRPSLFFVRVLCNTLISTKNLARNDNFCGNIVYPFPPVPGITSNLYAVKITDDSFKKSGLPSGSVVFFTPDVTPDENDLAVVTINKAVYVRRVAIHNDRISISTDRKKEEFFYQGDNDGDVVVLGKIVGKFVFDNA